MYYSIKAICKIHCVCIHFTGDKFSRRLSLRGSREFSTPQPHKPFKVCCHDDGGQDCMVAMVTHIA